MNYVADWISEELDDLIGQIDQDVTVETSIDPRLQAVAEAAVIGIPNEQWGEVGMAVIAVKPGHTLTPAEIHAHCQANLARFKCPRLIEFIDALPRNATGKIHKPTLRQQ
ncbi:AMP-binding enzyme, partial [Escherichia coli]|uniref:AMP-binding enzyme n=1 Tax=Escherichia coli TaxID=562 RepID=UPI003F773886